MCHWCRGWKFCSQVFKRSSNTTVQESVSHLGLGQDLWLHVLEFEAQHAITDTISERGKSFSGESTRPLTPTLLEKVSRYTSHFYSRCFCKSMPSSCPPPICITIRLPFVLRYFCRSTRVRGCWNTPSCVSKYMYAHPKSTATPPQDTNVWCFSSSPKSYVMGYMTAMPGIRYVTIRESLEMRLMHGKQRTSKAQAHRRNQTSVGGCHAPGGQDVVGKDEQKNP